MINRYFGQLTPKYNTPHIEMAQAAGDARVTGEPPVAGVTPAATPEGTPNAASTAVNMPPQGGMPSESAAETAYLETGLYDMGAAEPRELLRQAGLPTDELHVEIVRELLARGQAPLKETVARIAEIAKKIDYIANNLTAEAAREAANLMLKERRAASAVPSAAAGAKAAADVLARSFERMAEGMRGARVHAARIPEQAAEAVKPDIAGHTKPDRAGRTKPDRVKSAGTDTEAVWKAAKTASVPHARVADTNNAANTDKGASDTASPVIAASEPQSGPLPHVVAAPEPQSGSIPVVTAPKPQPGSLPHVVAAPEPQSGPSSRRELAGQGPRAHVGYTRNDEAILTSDDADIDSATHGIDTTMPHRGAERADRARGQKQPPIRETEARHDAHVPYAAHENERPRAEPDDGFALAGDEGEWEVDIDLLYDIVAKGRTRSGGADTVLEVPREYVPVDEIPDEVVRAAYEALTDREDTAPAVPAAKVPAAAKAAPTVPDTSTVSAEKAVSAAKAAPAAPDAKTAPAAKNPSAAPVKSATREENDDTETQRRAAVRMMIALDVPATRRNLDTILSYYQKIESLRAVTPDAAAVAADARQDVTVDALLAAAAYTKSVKAPRIDEATLSELEGQIRKLFEKSGLPWDDAHKDIAKAILRNDGGVTPENVKIIEKLLADVDTLLKGNSEEFAALLYKKGIDPGSATLGLLGDLQKLLTRMERVRGARVQSITRGYQPERWANSYMRMGTDSLYDKAPGEAELSKLTTRIAELLGAERATPEMIDAGKALVRAGIEVNAENVERFFAIVDKLRSQGAVFDSLTKIRDQGEPVELKEIDQLIENLRETGRLILDESTKSDPRLARVEKLVEMIGQLRVRDFSAIAQLMKHDIQLTLKNLSAVYASRDVRIDAAVDVSAERALIEAMGPAPQSSPFAPAAQVTASSAQPGSLPVIAASEPQSSPFAPAAQVTTAAPTTPNIPAVAAATSPNIPTSPAVSPAQLAEPTQFAMPTSAAPVQPAVSPPQPVVFPVIASAATQSSPLAPAAQVTASSAQPGSLPVIAASEPQSSSFAPAAQVTIAAPTTPNIPAVAAATAPDIQASPVVSAARSAVPTFAVPVQSAVSSTQPVASSVQPGSLPAIASTATQSGVFESVQTVVSSTQPAASSAQPGSLPVIASTATQSGVFESVQTTVSSTQSAASSPQPGSMPVIAATEPQSSSFAPAAQVTASSAQPGSLPVIASTATQSSSAFTVIAATEPQSGPFAPAAQVTASSAQPGSMPVIEATAPDIQTPAVSPAQLAEPTQSAVPTVAAPVQPTASSAQPGSMPVIEATAPDIQTPAISPAQLAEPTQSAMPTVAAPVQSAAQVAASSAQPGSLPVIAATEPQSSSFAPTTQVTASSVQSAAQTAAATAESVAQTPQSGAFPVIAATEPQSSTFAPTVHTAPTDTSAVPVQPAASAPQPGSLPVIEATMPDIQAQPTVSPAQLAEPTQSAVPTSAAPQSTAPTQPVVSSAQLAEPTQSAANIPVTQPSIVNLYLANAAVKNIVELTRQEGFFSAGAYLYSKGVSLEDTSVVTLSPLLTATLAAVSRKTASDAYRNALSFRSEVAQNAVERLTEPMRDDSGKDAKGDSGDGGRDRPSASRGGDRRGVSARKKDDAVRGAELAWRRQEGREAGERHADSLRADNLRMGSLRTARESAMEAAGENAAARSGHGLYGTHADNVPGGGRGANGNAAETEGGAISPNAERANMRPPSADDVSVGAAAASANNAVGGTSSANASSVDVLSADTSSANVLSADRGGAFGGILERIISSISRLKDIGAGRLAWLTQSGVPASADALAAARSVVDNTYSVSRGMSELEDLLGAGELTDGGTGDDAAWRGDGGQSGGERAYAAGGGADGAARTGGSRGFSGMGADWGGLRISGQPGHTGGGDGRERDPRGDENARWDDASAPADRQFRAKSASATGGGTSAENGGEQSALARELRAMRGILPGTDLAALKNGAGISDIYNELKERLLAFESRLARLGLRQDDQVMRVVSSMKDNIRAQEQLNRGQVCFQIPFIYNQKPSSLTVYVFDRKNGGKGKKVGEALNVALNLETETLGTVDIGMVVAEKRVDLDITVSNRRVRDYLNGIKGDLGERVREAGFTVGEILCDVKGASGTRGARGQASRTQTVASAEESAAERGAAARRSPARMRPRAIMGKSWPTGVDIKV